jgi:hypothetical protein
MSIESIYTHGTALQAESPGELLGFTKYGWGAQVTFVKPRRGLDPRDPTSVEEQGPGSWFHLPLTTMPGSVARGFHYLTTVILVVETVRCRISDLHIYDGPFVIQQIHYATDVTHVPGGLHGTLVQPIVVDLRAPHLMRQAVGLSFYASSFLTDFPGHTPDGSEPGVLIVGAGGADYRVDPGIFTAVSEGIFQIR